MLVIVVGICAVLLTCRPVLLLSQLVTFSPEKLSMPVGDTAVFFCNISTANFPQFDYSLNWYKKINSTHTQKIAELNGNEHKIQKKKFILINHTSTVEIRILELTENDSGEYYCGLIAFSSPSKVMESNVSQLTVTGVYVGAPLSNQDITVAPKGTIPGPGPPRLDTVTCDFLARVNVVTVSGVTFTNHTATFPATDLNQEGRPTTVPNVTVEDPVGDFKVPVIIGLIIAGAVLLGLITYILFITMGGQQKPQRENALLKEQVTMYTVDYGVLEFQQDEHTEAPVASYPPDNTEYAVIVFPEEKPVTPERGKKTKHQRTCQI